MADPAKTSREARPANQRGVARLAAVRALYQMELAGTDIADVVAEFEAFRLGKEIDGEQYRSADAGWFRDLVGGVVAEQRAIDPSIHAALAHDWPLGRVDATLRAILRAGVYELRHRPDVPGRVVITEYVDVAKAFFAEDEPRIVNAVLDRLARELRPDEFTPAGPRSVSTDGGGSAGAPRSGEDALIARHFAPLATAGGALALTDDTAFYAPPPGFDLVLTKDAVASGIHFLPDDPGATVARKALRVNLSDLAAKGATPVGYLLALGLPDGWTEDWLADFAAGLAADQQTYGVSLYGGDTIRTVERAVISITAFGLVPTGGMVRRGAAQPGDRIVVTGTIGDAAIGLKLRLDAGLGERLGLAVADVDHLLDRYAHPQPRVAAAAVVRDHARAAMDVSDGLVGDLRKMATTSGVAIRLDAARVPLSPAGAAAVAADPALLLTAITGGDDYEIAAAVPPDAVAAYIAGCAAVGVAATEIGEVTAGKPGVTLTGGDGAGLVIERGSFSHF